MNALTKVNTHFTGLATFERGCAIAQQVGRRLRRKLKLRRLKKVSFKIKSMCDIDKAVQQYLKTTHLTPCLFKDVLDCVKLSKRVLTGNLPLARKVKLAMSAKLASKAFCLNHNKRCPVTVPGLLGGGHPCGDYSMAGKRKRDAGDTLMPTLASGPHVLGHAFDI